MLVREFLFKNFVPFTWYDSDSDKGQKLMTSWGSPQRSPVIEFGDGRRLINPGLRANWRRAPGLAELSAGPGGSGDYRRRTGGNGGGCLCGLRGRLDGRAGPAGAWRPGGRIIQDRKLHGLSERPFRRGSGDAERASDAQIRREDGSAGGCRADRAGTSHRKMATFCISTAEPSFALAPC